MSQCSLCHSSKAQVVYQFTPYSILRCRKCGLLRRNRQLTSSELKRLFSPHYFTQEQRDYFKGQFSKHINLRLNRNRSFIDRLKTLEQLIGPQPKTILDVGCGSGVFLKLAQGRGWQGVGLDIAPYPVRFARHTFGLDVRLGTLGTVTFPPRSFTVVTSWDVLPNMQQPQRLFQVARRVLRPEGILSLQCTVVDSVLNFASQSIYKLTQGQISYYAEKGLPFQHAHHFTRTYVHRFFATYGFEVIKNGNYEMDYRYSSLPRKYLPLLKITSLAAQLLGKTVLYRLYARKR